MQQENLLGYNGDLNPQSSAEISEDGRYRYFLSRRWNSALPAVAFIGLNPSTANAAEDDPTIRRCISFARSWGGGALWMVNLFAMRSTDPRALQSFKDPVGPKNDEWIDFAAQHAQILVAAWGNHGNFLGRAASVAGRHQQSLQALHITKRGMPKHPLYVKGDAVPFAYINDASLGCSI